MAFQGDSIFWVEVEKVVPNPFQPRREFDESKLVELGESIRMYGVLQPLTVTRKEVQRDDGTFYTEYELIAGERRLRASKLAGVAQVPVIIREGEQNEQEKLELAIIENLQREDLNAVDRAVAFKQLAEQFGLSHVQVAKKMGRSREYVSNSIRLLGLPKHMLESLGQGKMMEGHARTLLMLTDRPEEQEVVYKEILLKKLSVREVERIVRKIATEKVRKRKLTEADLGLIEFEKKFTETLGTRVQILKTDFGGKLTIDYFSEDDLKGILERMHEEKVDGSGQDNSAAAKITSDTALNIVPETKSNIVTSAPEVVSEAIPTPPVVSTMPPQTESIPETLINSPIETDDVQSPVTTHSHSDEVREESSLSMPTAHSFATPTPAVGPTPEPSPTSVPTPVSTPVPSAEAERTSDLLVTHSPSLQPTSSVFSQSVPNFAPAENINPEAVERGSVLPKLEDELPQSLSVDSEPSVFNNATPVAFPAVPVAEKREDFRSQYHNENTFKEPVEKTVESGFSEQGSEEVSEKTFKETDQVSSSPTEPHLPVEEKKLESKDDSDLYSMSNFTI